MALEKGRRPAKDRARSAWESATEIEAFDLIGVLEALLNPVTGPDCEDLRQMFIDDQRDRENNVLSEGSALRDRQRRTAGLRKLTEGQVQTPADFYHLAMLLQHGGRAEHYHLAHELARRAAVAGHRPGAWLTAAAHDRYLMQLGLPQRYGTQYICVEGRWCLYQVDPSTTDEDRAAFDVPTLKQAKRRAESINDEEHGPE